jgi:hypothetical protein
MGRAEERLRSITLWARRVVRLLGARAIECIYGGRSINSGAVWQGVWRQLGVRLMIGRHPLDITAVPGGGLLGDLLCALAGLLDPNGFLNELIGTLTQLLDLLNQINQLL